MKFAHDIKLKSVLIALATVGVGAAGLSMVKTGENSRNSTPEAQPALPDDSMSDRSKSRELRGTGKKQVGKASFYADDFSGKTMADGTPMSLASNNAASLTLPLGTTAKVTNLENGKAAIITIRDRGPYAKGRIVDLSPATARQIGLSKSQGLARVVVQKIRVPARDGTTSDGTIRLASLRSHVD
jgi:rare lipoprotein A